MEKETKMHFLHMRILTCAEMGYICTYRKPIKSPIIRPDKKHIMMMIGSQLIDSFNKLKSVHTLLFYPPTELICFGLA